MGWLSSIGNFAGNALSKIGSFGAGVVGKIGSLGVPIYRAANAASGGLIGNALESIPGVGGILKTVGQKLGDPGFLNSATNAFRGIGAAGAGLSKLADDD